MSTTVHTYVPILGKRIRVTELKDDGSVGDFAVATDGFVTITLTAQIEAGTEIIQRNAYGVLCVNELLASNFKRFTVAIDFCAVSPAILAIVANADEYDDYAGDFAGFTMAEGIIQGQFALELWTGIAGAIYDDNADGYFLLPFVHKGNLSDIKVDGQNAVTFSLANAYTMNGNAWGVGPYDVVVNNDSPGVAAPLPTALDPYDHLLMIDTAVAAPPSASDLIPVTSFGRWDSE